MAYLTAMIGPYALEPDGVPRVGGMGEVHLARHAASGLPVAIKVLPAFLAARAEARAAFLDEVRHTARLCHPNVVALDDFGTLADGPAAGSPWLAMERADGALDRLALPRDWPTLQARLRAILLGLAHAHACGLVHLDLKPSNVLVFGAGDPAPRLALADFGIARLYTEPGAAAHAGAGTPAYMAPEQFSPQLGALGPPADVYAVGCLAHALVTGRAPFEGPTWFEYARQHLGVTPPPLAPRFALPGAFAGWLALLLRKTPEARPACAADALYALASLSEAPEVAGLPPAAPTAPALEATAAGPTETGATPPAGLGRAPEVSGSLPDAPPPIAPCPESWVDPVRADWRPWSPGPGLYPLRRLPLVGRPAARDALWGALRAVATTRRPRVCVVRGDLGVGKSAVLAWLGERAHETGAAVVAVAQGGAGADDVFGGVLARLVGAQPDDTPLMLAGRVRQRLGRDAELPASDLSACVELLRARHGHNETSTALPTLDARWAAIRRLLGRAAGGRAMLLLVDDAQDAPAVLGFAERLTRVAGDALPLLCVLAVRDAVEPDSPAAPRKGLVDDLVSRAGVETVPLGPMSPGETTHLVRTLLGLEPTLAARVEAVCGGRPQHAVGLVSAWVADDRLRRGRYGAELVESPTGGAMELPPDLARLGEALSERALARATAMERLALHVAACLGGPFEPDDWHAVCARAVPDHPWAATLAGLRERLLAEGRLRVVEPPAARLGFEVEAMAHALRGDAAQAGGAAALHGLIAEALAPRLSPAALGRHLCAAGRAEAAVAPLLTGMRAALELADTRTAAVVAEVLDTALDLIGAPDDHADRLTAALLEARLARMRGALPAARAKITPVLARATAGPLAAEAWLERGRVEWNTGDALAAKDALGRAWQLAVAAGAARLAADARRIHGLVELHGGALPAAATHFEAARRAYAAQGERVWESSCRMNLGVAARQAGELAEAAAHVHAARAGHAEAGADWGVAECENELGELARLAGDWAGAAAHYAAARALNDALGSGDAVFNELNLALVRLETGDLEAARNGLSRGRAVLEAQGRLAVAHAVRVLECVAETLAPGVVEAVTLPRAEEAARALAACGFVDADVARWAARARDHAGGRGAPALADVFDRIHRSQQNALTGGSPS